MRKSVKTAIFGEIEAFEHSRCKLVAIVVAAEEDRLQCRLDLYVGAHNAMIDLEHHGRGAQKVCPLALPAVAPPGAAM